MSSQVEPLSQSLKQSSDAFGAALRQVQVSLAGIQHSVEPNSPLNYQLTHTLAQLSSAAQAVQELADYLQRNPSAVVRGRYTGDESDR
jgi:paraquat-inducible protein B